MPWKDPEKKKQYMKKYSQRPEVKAKKKKYNQTPKVKTMHEKYRKTTRAITKRRERRRAPSDRGGKSRKGKTATRHFILRSCHER